MSFFDIKSANDKQMETIRRFVDMMEADEPSFEVFNVETFDWDCEWCMGDIFVTVESYHFLNASMRHCYQFVVGRRGGAYVVADNGAKRYLKPTAYDRARIY